MKAVLISIQPKWCELIASGKKTVEVRKTLPKLKTPFKVYIYCTLPPQEELFTHGCIREYAHELIRLQDGRIVYDYGMRLCCDIENRPYSQDNFLCKKVIGEFVCDRIRCEKEVADGLVDIVLESTSCVAARELVEYASGNVLYSWHISDLVIYDKPRELSEFYQEGKSNDRYYYDYCSGCPHHETPICEYPCNECDGNRKYLYRPPQSWCYVESEGEL